jgi:hypothetical protein
LYKSKIKSFFLLISLLLKFLRYFLFIIKLVIKIYK